MTVLGFLSRVQKRKFFRHRKSKKSRLRVVSLRSMGTWAEPHQKIINLVPTVTGVDCGPRRLTSARDHLSGYGRTLTLCTPALGPRRRAAPHRTAPHRGSPGNALKARAPVAESPVRAPWGSCVSPGSRCQVCPVTRGGPRGPGTSR